MKFAIKDRFFDNDALVIHIDCEEGETEARKLGLAVAAAVKVGESLIAKNLTGADLEGMDLRGANLEDAKLENANLRGADLRGAVLYWASFSGADLTGAKVDDAPKIEKIHQKVFAAASAEGALYMRMWHSCETTHCQAGWVTTLAGKEGTTLENRMGTEAAATLIYLASDPEIGKMPNFYADSATALADMKRRVEAEMRREEARKQ